MRILPPLLLVCALLASSVGTGPVGAQTPPPDNSKVSPALLTRMAANALALEPVVVEMDHATAPFVGAVNTQRAQAAAALLAQYGTLVGQLAIVDSAAGWANAAAINAIAAAPGVAYIHEDRTVSPRPNRANGPAWPPGRLSSLDVQETHADQVWPTTRGAGMTVAVLDSGVAANADLGPRLLGKVNFADDPGPSGDPGGHGTHVAGIVAAGGAVTNGQYLGIAPAANVVDVRVIGAKGQGRISSVIAGIQWALDHRAAYNIHVLNMSFAAPPPPSGSYRADLLSSAVEIAVKRGVAVVTASGNSGPGSGTVGSPGIDPVAITVGATDDQGTLSLADDTLAWFSSWGGGRPDLVAPGRRVVSNRVPGSLLDVTYPDHVMTASNGATVFRLSGTSQATAVVSGALALLLAQHPTWTPDQLKSVLVATTQPYGPGGVPGLPDPSADGAGLLNVQAALASPVRSGANSGVRPADGLLRTLYPALYGQPLVWKDPHYLGIDWSQVTWQNIAWDNIAWDNIAWDNIAWDNIAWDNIAWD